MQETSDVDVARFTRLSTRARAAWAKSNFDQVTTEIVSWLPLYQHLADTGAVASLIWDEWLAPSVKNYIADEAGGEETARAVAIWLAAVHDIGKLSPAFAVQVPPLAHQMTTVGLAISSQIAGTDERRLARHEVVSHFAVADWLTDSHGLDRALSNQLASVLAAHHGLPPDDTRITWTRARPHLAGDATWHASRIELLEAMTAVTSSDVAAWRGLRFSQPTLVLLSAFVIVADWIASSDHFELVPVGAHPRESASERAQRAWQRLSLPEPWKARPPADDEALFHSRFSLPADAAPRPIQSAMMSLARTMPEPGLVILEAEMGVGKTEAALAAAEILAARFGRSGIFVGLPTQATADGMFARVLEWARKLELDTPNSVYLAHGKARLNETNAALLQDARFRALHIGDPQRIANETDELAVAHVWMGNAKRGPLANLVVGTIDQALFGALRSRHLMLRHLALTGKVVILDEVHAYDAYSGQYLERVLHWLGTYQVPVIMLSATLPSARRRAFVAAYDSGRQPSTPRPRRSRSWGPASASADPDESLTGDIGYPSIVVSQRGGIPMVLTPGATGASRRVALQRIPDDLTTLRDLLRDALADGGCAVVIRNTVGRVQETASALRQEFGDDVIVAHSRFLGLDRARKDRQLLELFGRDGERPHRAIVVASQVVEQSLDIDFDLMVTDTAPIDLLLQRAGRLHRHARARRPAPVSRARLVLTGTDWGTTPPDPVRGSRVVYDEHILLRTLAVLDGRDEVSLPTDIPSLVQEVYSNDTIGAAEWSPAMVEAARKSTKETTRKRADADHFRLGTVPAESSTTLLGWVHGATSDPATESRAQATVRDSEETLEVLIIQQDADGTLHTPDWLPGGGEQIPENALPDHRLTNTILGCSLRLPLAICGGASLDRHIRTLEKRYPVAAWHGSHALRGELVLVLGPERNAALDPYELVYSPEDGLSFSRPPSVPESEVPL